MNNLSSRATVARAKRGLGHSLWRVASFVRRETVLTIAAAFACVSCILVPPDAAYLGYIDIETLGKLFSLMVIMAGFQRIGLFRRVAKLLLGRVGSLAGIALVLVGLCFFSSMLITNDVALVTFVPLALMLLGMAGAGEQACLVVTLMTVAANLGSMATPMGNPQNLYLFSTSGMGMGEFIALMAPFTALAACMLVVCIVVGLRASSAQAGMAGAGLVDDGPVDRPRAVAYALLFVLSIACVAGVVPLAACVVVVALAAALLDRGLFRSVDYGLLLTFVAFYIFVGNLERFGPFHDALGALVDGREMIVAVLASQVISNVPAALLLSGFTSAWPELIIGTNLGGLGTLIASMASLISYKQLALVQPRAKGRFVATFTVLNVAFLVVLVAFALIGGWR